MKKFLVFIDGHKTYLALIGAGVLYSLQYWGIIDEKMYNYLITLDSLMLAGAIRSAMKKFEK